MSYHAYLAGEPDGYHDEAGLVVCIAASSAVITANNLAARLSWRESDGIVDMMVAIASAHGSPKLRRFGAGGIWHLLGLA